MGGEPVAKSQPFGHEKLMVYQKAMRFAARLGTLLDRLSRRVAACEHLDRAGESILVNIAHACSAWSAKERPDAQDRGQQGLRRPAGVPHEEGTRQTLNRSPYSDTLHRLAYTTTSRSSSPYHNILGAPTVNPEGPIMITNGRIQGTIGSP